MPVTAADAGSILRPYFEMADLLASTQAWQEITDTDNTADALLTIDHPDYFDFENSEGSIEVPLIVISNPLDMEATYHRKTDRQGRRDFGALLVQFFLKQTDDPKPLQDFMHACEGVLSEALGKSETLKPDGEHYYLTLDYFQLAIAAAACDLNRLSCVERNADNLQPQIVNTMAFVAHWI